ncbi:hypothetical protein EDC96DRAFT_520068 [Choanephora cucurbitarum]|nr:hypothetical protein EDC96DRAFT_520068 [Choanephora cucurbitarum]
MGLLSFRKRSKKQQASITQSNIDSSSSLAVHKGQDYFSLPATNLANHQELSRANEMSLMDDIMNELSASKAQANLHGKSIVPSAGPIFNDPAVPGELEYAKSSKMQQKPPLHFSGHDSKKPTFLASQQVVHQESKKIQQQRHSFNVTNSNKHEANLALGSNSPMTSSPNRYSAPVTLKKSSAAPNPPAASDSSHTIVPESTDLSKNIMDRLKERHRQETRTSFSPFGNRATSSPSMPIINGTTVDLSNKNKLQKKLTQSQSFMTYARLSNKNENSQGEGLSATNGRVERQSSPLQAKPDTSLHHLNYLPQPHQVMHQQPLLSSTPIQEKDGFEAAPVVLGYPINRSVSAYPGLPTHSIQQQQQILLQQHQIQQQQLHQQQIQYQIELQQQRLEEQQRLQQQKLHQLQLEQKKQHEQDDINRAILDSLVTSSLETHQNNEAAKHHFSLKPLYKRTSESTNKSRKSHHHHYHHHRRQCGCHTNHHSRQPTVASKGSKVCTPPPELHQAIITETEQPLEISSSPIALTDEEGHISNTIDALIVNSSSSTLGVESKPNEEKRLSVARLPRRLKRELQDMHLRRSLYSLPDLSKLSQEQVPETDEPHFVWDTLSLFHSMLDKDGLSASKFKERHQCRVDETIVNNEGRNRCSRKSKNCHHHHHKQCKYHYHSRHCCSATKRSNCSHNHGLEVSAADCISSARKNSVELDYRASICRSKKHCKR